MVQNVVGVNINFLQESLYNPEEDARESQYRIKKKKGGEGVCGVLFLITKSLKVMYIR